MSVARGALIVFEGCDRAGKSTQVKMLIEALKKRSIPTEARAFPDRTTPIGTLINNFLTKKQEFSPETVHLLFCANRWECKEDILNSLYSGTTVVIDRYAASGAAYTSAVSGRCLNFCKTPDKGLPSPDLVILLKISEESQSTRSNWGSERYEYSKLQQSVAINYEKLIEQSWSVIDANQEKLTIHSQVLQQVLDTIEKVKSLPIEKLYTSQN
ncbi:thymidylate kinase [Osmia bicornis bicornis]|uniref:thymidylate kinase n=1 Tax=Osmia bicornis bicornis TaxID=1437191 RepID=UPI0010F7A1FB|nr:thymidylate kinase [Osmia bicornis bicornis]